MKGFDKKGWKKITFGEVCINANETEKDPLGKGMERYVGLEHIETENLHIKTWGNVADGTTFTKTFKKGQVLFGKRRAYLKKAAVAEFDGLCSGDILVFEPNEKVIDKRLFPFLVSSDRFFDYAVQTSAGSLSPRTKFQDLAKFEFLLPPKEQQVQLAELLWAANNVVNKLALLNQMILLTKASLIYDLFQKDVSLITMKVGDICQVQRGKFTHRPRNEPKFYGGDIPFIQTSDVVSAPFGKIVSYSQTLNHLGLSISKLFPKGTIVMTIAANIGDIAELTFDAAFPDSLVGLTPNTKIINRQYFIELMKINKGEFEKNATKGAQMNLSNEILNKIVLKTHPLNLQYKIADRLSKFLLQEEKLTSHINFSYELHKKLINQIF